MVLRAGASDSYYTSTKLGGPSLVLVKAGGRKIEEGGLPEQKSLNSSETKTLIPANLRKTLFPSNTNGQPSHHNQSHTESPVKKTE